MSIFNAVSIPFFGDIHVLRVEELGLPNLQPDQVLVNSAAASVNPIDCKTRAGLGWAAAHNKDKLPWVLGYDLSGTVTATGHESFEHLIGKRVFGMIGFPYAGGAYSQCVAVKAEELLLVPDTVDLVQAAALPLAGLTAYQALYDHGELKQGQRVLVLGATGGVGHIAAQLALAENCEVVSTGSLAKQAKLKADLSGVNWQNISDLAGESFDLVLDCVGGQVAVDLLNEIASVKTWVTLPSVTAEQVKTKASEVGAQCINFLVSPNITQLAALIDLVAQGKLKLHIHHCYCLADVALAHSDIEQGKVCGKVLLQLDE